MHQYSVVISPPDAVIEQVRQLKQMLRAAIGWYPSANALAHISFHLFRANAISLPHWETYIADFSLQQVPVSLWFNRVASFANGAFFLAPDEASERTLTGMMKAFLPRTSLSAQKPAVPHMSIGRRLNADQLSVARSLVGEVNISFVCHDLVLRRLNEDRLQYDIYKRFPFGGIASLQPGAPGLERP